VTNSRTVPIAGEPALGRSVSIDQAARLLDVSRRTIYNRIRDGRLRTVRTMGRSQRVLLESLREQGSARRGLTHATQAGALSVTESPAGG
jgi:excisionase family DNA binding protein